MLESVEGVAGTKRCEVRGRGKVGLGEDEERGEEGEHGQGVEREKGVEMEKGRRRVALPCPLEASGDMQSPREGEG